MDILENPKVKLGNNVFVYPMPMSLVGTVIQGKINFMAVGWVSRVNANPPMIGVAISKRHYTVSGIEENKAFSVNYPSLEQMQKADYCGVVSGKKEDKSTVFETFSGDLPNAPMIRDCPLCLACKLVQVVPLPSNSIYIGEIVEAYTEEKFMTDGKLDIKKMKPFVLTMPDNNYWAIGESVGKAWNIGLQFKPEK